MEVGGGAWREGEGVRVGEVVEAGVEVREVEEGWMDVCSKKFVIIL